MSWLAELRTSLQGSTADAEADAPSVDTLREALAKKGLHTASPDDLAEVAEGSDVEFLRRMHREFSGLGELIDPLMDPTVTDVVVNPDGSMWVDRGAGMQRVDRDALDPDAVRDLAIHMAARCGSRLDNAMPFADGVLRHLPSDIPAKAVRLHCVLSPPAQHGPSLSLRVLSAGFGNLQILQESGMLPGGLQELLSHMVAQRKNFLISGGTGAGKTSLLTALLAEVPPHQRIVLLEDTPEIMAQHPHIVALTARQPNAEGLGEISMAQLVKQSLRMRPDRLVVGEIRGAEIADLLVALNTGHAGSAGTIHANSPQAVPGRLEALGAMAGMSPRALLRQALDGIDMIVHVARTPTGRQVTHVARLVERDGLLATEMVWRAS